MDNFGRKTCATCGHTCLESESRCWACGGDTFDLAGASPVTDRTMALHHPADRTLSWSRSMGSYLGALWPPPVALLYVAGLIAFAFFTTSIGFWIGRASSADEAPPAVVPPSELTV